MPSRKAVRADDKRLKTPGQKQKLDKHGNGPRSRMELYEAGLLKIEDMDDKELEKGKWRNSAGTFKGVGTPKMLPRKFADELQAERIRRWNKKVQEDLEPMRQVLREIALNPRASADARHKSAVYLIERSVGKVPEKSEVKLEVAKWEQDIEGILVGDDDNEPEG